MVVDTAPTLILPPPDRAYWRAPEGSAGPLLYLGWGGRQFGLAPIQEHRHEGWVYTMVEAGSPVIVLENRQEQIPAPALAIIGPNCAFGWTDSAKQSSKLLVWMWSRPMHPAISRLRSDAYVHYPMSTEEMAELRHLHAMTRAEVYLADKHTDLALKGLQAMIEARIARIVDRITSDGGNTDVEQALHWLRNHLDTRQPLARLADYLGVSPATVQRLFREHLGTTVMTSMAALRCKEAERMLEDGKTTIKEVAYRLGYRHPHDFSRAFRKHTGKLPPRFRPTSG